MTGTTRRYGVARDVNPDAGMHAISSEPAERAAAEAATRQSWREFPYYPRRYGERGWRFSLSDSGWISTLSDSTDSEALTQLRWLAQLLAARGMPQYLLERHLFHLHAALTEVMPGDVMRYARLHRCADALRAQRVGKIPEEQFVALARDFEFRARNSESRIPNMGVVLVSAVVDDALGLGDVARNVGDWATDESRFDASWRTAVRDTVSAARRQVSSSV